MATNNFKAFALDPNANVMSQADWEALPALLSGFTAGKASSAQVNKAIRQASFIAAALAQYTSDKTGDDVLDDGDQAAFIAKMAAAFGKDFQPLDATLTALAALTGAVDKLPYFNGADTAALTALTTVGRDIIGKSSIADVLSYLGLKESKQIVFTSSAQLAIPASITEIYVTGCAAGGGGAPGAGGSNAYFGGGGCGGGAGQSIIKKKFTVTPGSSLMITIGAAGVGGVGNVDRGGVATAGGDTIIGALQTLKGGSGGSNAINGTDGATGGISGSGYPSGGYGNDGHITAGCASGGSGASSPFGGGGGSGRAGTQGGMAGSAADGYGAGGGGGGGKYGNNAGVASGGSGGNGSQGFVIIEW